MRIEKAPIRCPVCARSGLRMSLGELVIAQDGCGLFVPLIRTGLPGPLTGSRSELGEPSGDPEESLPRRVRCRRGHELIVDQALADFVLRKELLGGVPVFARAVRAAP